MLAQACFLSTLLLTASVFAEVLEEETDYKISKGTPFKDGAEEYVLTDNDGNFAGVVDLFVDEGYQIDKPNDKENVCLVRKINNEVTEDVCYVRRSISHDQMVSLNMTKVLEHCKDREVFLEEPNQCAELDLEIGRQKRSNYPTGNRCCHYRKRTSVTCKRTEKVCCLALFICFLKCDHCVEHTKQEITELHCHTD